MGALLFLLGSAALYVALLVYPAPLFAHHQRIDGFRVHSDRVPSIDAEQLVTEVTRRLAAMEHGPESEVFDIYLCHSLRRYSFFARLTRRTPSSQAIGLSAPGNVFVSMARLEELATHRGGLLAASRFEGSPAFAVAHELAHFGIVDSLGMEASRSLPAWKSEGWADYQANLAAIRGNPNYDLAQRVDLLDAPGYWHDPRLRARRFYAWQLLVEYLVEVRGYGFDDLSQPSITESETLELMRAWRRATDRLDRPGRQDGGTS